MSYKAKDGRPFMNHQQGRAYDDRIAASKTTPVEDNHQPDGDEEGTDGSVTCPHCGEEIKLHGKKNEEAASEEHQEEAPRGIPGLS